MDYFLIDYENTGESGLKGIRDLGEDTCTVIFYSENADKISFEMHQILCNCRTKLEFRKVYTGKKNALDFQLSTYLGFLIATNPENHFFIVSKDNGYRVVMEFWKEKKIRQIDSISRAHAKPLMIETRKPLQVPAVPETASASGEPAEATQQETAESLKQDSSEIASPKPMGTPVQTSFTAMNAPQTPIREKTANIQKTPANIRETPAEVLTDERQAGVGVEAVKTEQVAAAYENPNVQELSEQKSVQTEQKTENREQAVANPEERAEKQTPKDNGSDENAEPSGIHETPDLKKEAAEKEKRPHRGGRRKKTASQEPPVDEFRPSPELKAAIAQVIEGKEEQEHIGRFIVKYKTKQGVNNAIVKLYGTEKAGELYKKIKPLLKDKKGK